jgi:hypothetical protein
MASQSTDPKWYSIAKQASTEMDPQKLTILVAQLLSALDELEKPSELQCDQTQQRKLRLCD